MIGPIDADDADGVVIADGDTVVDSGTAVAELFSKEEMG